MNGDRPPMKRDNRQRPCPVCGRPDWCLISEDGSAAICPRISEGSAAECGEAGWLHVFGDRPADTARRRRRTVRVDAAERRDFGPLSKRFSAREKQPALGQLAKDLGVSVASLARLGIGWSAEHAAWTFPMSDADGFVTGIRLRAPDGRKWAVTGSRDGLFVPRDLAFDDRVLVCEGPTDTAALLDLGFEAVGRPSCAGGKHLVCELAQRHKVPEVVIVADNGGPGVRGAESLASTLILYCPAVRIIYPPDGISDARAWVQAGATYDAVLETIEAASVRRLTIGRSES